MGNAIIKRGVLDDHPRIASVVTFIFTTISSELSW